jgi:RNA polymerase sigma factor (sigma-70 family)
VYSAALRQVESADLAADIAQGVFVDLARKAKPVGERLTTGTSLAGWLHRGTRYAALNHLRDTRRRLANERQAMEQLLTNSESSADWEQIRPALDEALDTLGDEDREALLLRYFKNQDFRTVGLALGVNDDAAQKRVSRAVERLREFFSNRKLTVGASGLAVLISANAVQAAPVGLAATISITAILAGTAVSTSTVIAAAKAIAMTTLQKTLVTATLAVVAGAGIYEAHQATQLRRQNQTLQQEQAPLAEQIQKLQRERDEATNRLAELFAENARLKSHSNENELLKLRGEVGVLRAQLASA